MFAVLSICKGGGYRYCRTDPPHPRRNSAGLYPLHIVLMENKLGRLLVKGETVHHRDNDKSNDDPENLAVMSNARHARHHAVARAPRPSRRKCLCGRSFVVKPHAFRYRIARNISGRIYCSANCATRFGTRIAAAARRASIGEPFAVKRPA